MDIQSQRSGSVPWLCSGLALPFYCPPSSIGCASATEVNQHAGTSDKSTTPVEEATLQERAEALGALSVEGSDQVADALTWATPAAAVEAFDWVRLLAHTSEERAQGCPSVTEVEEETAGGRDRAIVVVEGDGCVDDDGLRWSGRVSWTSEWDAEGDAGHSEYADLAITHADVVCDDGQELPWVLADGTRWYDYDDETEEEQLSVQGSVTLGYPASSCADPLEVLLADVTGPRSYASLAGSGFLATPEAGYVEFEMEAEKRRSGCSIEPWSGSHTRSAGGHTAVVSYDGATGCGSEPSAPWTLDGVDMGHVTVTVDWVKPF
jgi:hypothetical protein